MMAWWAASIVAWLVHVNEIGSPAEPPEDTITEAPAALAEEISAAMVGSLPTGRVSPQMSLQPSPMVKAAVKERSPSEEMTVFSTPSCELDMSTYGATCPTEALAGAAETIAVSIRPEAASSTEDPAATRRGLPRRLRTPIPTPSAEIPGKFLK